MGSGHGHSHGAGGGPIGWFLAIFHLHGHSHDQQAPTSDPSYATDEGIRTVWIALAALGVTTLLQFFIVAMSGSVALLADTVHNLGDMLNSIPLLVAFYLARRLANRQYTYGYGRAEDVAGILIVASIVFSAGYILWESVRKLLDPEKIANPGWVAAAAIVGAVGNEIVAWFQIRTGRRIGSDAMIADGLHARIDGMTSLAVLIAVAGSVLGAPILDPIVGLLIGVAIVFIAKDATLRIWYRLMDAVDPAITDQIEQYASEVPGVAQVSRVRARWVGHGLYADVAVEVEPNRTQAETLHTVASLRELLHKHLRHLDEATVEVLPASAAGERTGCSPRVVISPNAILPPRYQDPNVKVSAAPMGAAALKFDDSGAVAWNEVWGGFCELALAGGAPHRGTLLEPVNEDLIEADPERYAWVLDELERGIRQVTDLEVVRSDVPGWIGMECLNEEMALWLLRAIVVENVTVRREGKVLWFPAGPQFRLEREIKNVVTVVAKTNHYWQEHIAGALTTSH